MRGGKERLQLLAEVAVSDDRMIEASSFVMLPGRDSVCVVCLGFQIFLVAFDVPQWWFVRSKIISMTVECARAHFSLLKDAFEARYFASQAKLA
jgi:hypothetical protein